MRERTNRDRVIAFMRRLGRVPGASGRIYLTGGACAVLEGWRETTVDIDVELDGDAERLLREIPAIKNDLRINVELAAPHHFLPELPGWRDRSRFIGTEGSLHFFHYDAYSQVLSKLERGHRQDLADVESILTAGLIEPDRLSQLFEAIVPELYRYPAVDPLSLRRKVEAFTRAAKGRH